MATINRIRLILALVLLGTITAFSQQKQSPRKQAFGNISDVIVEVDYGAPSVRNRVIWGNLVPFGKVWRAGANENTTISFSKAVKIGGNLINAGTYGFFIIPNEEDKWTVILSSKNDGWGAFSYKQEEDVLRLPIEPEYTEKNEEMLSFEIGIDGIQFSWANVTFIIPIE